MVSWWPPRMRLPSAASARASPRPSMSSSASGSTDCPVEGRPGGRLAQLRPRVPPMASSLSRDSDRANRAAAFHVRKLGKNVSTPCASCAAEVLDRRQLVVQRTHHFGTPGSEEAGGASACGRDSSRSCVKNCLQFRSWHGSPLLGLPSWRARGPARTDRNPVVTRPFACARADAPSSGSCSGSGWPPASPRGSRSPAPAPDAGSSPRWGKSAPPGCAA